jgi:Glycosyl hydrolase family 9
VLQVGGLAQDHNLSATDPLTAEQYLHRNPPRPVRFVSDSSPGGDLIAEAVSAFAACALAFADADALRAARLRAHARTLYTWMASVKQAGTRYSDASADFQATYPSSDPHANMMAAAAWMHRLTREERYVEDAQAFHKQARALEGEPVVNWSNPLPVRPWSLAGTSLPCHRDLPTVRAAHLVAVDDVVYRTHRLTDASRFSRWHAAQQAHPAATLRIRLQEAKLLLLEQRPGDADAWLPSLQAWVDDRMTGADASYTPKGLWFVDRWGPLRNAAMAAHVALRTAAFVDSRSVGPDDARQLVWAHYARCFASQQMRYIMGSAGHSFVTGWGAAPPARPHHRNALCAYVTKGEDCTFATFNEPGRKFANVLSGALVGGPGANDQWRDTQVNLFSSQVSTEYNAALVSGAALRAHVVALRENQIARLPNCNTLWCDCDEPSRPCSLSQDTLLKRTRATVQVPADS